MGIAHAVTVSFGVNEKMTCPILTTVKNMLLSLFLQVPSTNRFEHAIIHICTIMDR